MSLGFFSKQNFVIQLCLLGLGFLIAMYSLYSLKVFVDVYNLPTKYIAVVQTIFMIWNAVNDPLMGYIQQITMSLKVCVKVRQKYATGVPTEMAHHWHTPITVQDVGCGVAWLMKRRKVIMYMGPVWAVVSLIFWFPWSTSSPMLVAIHYTIALFLYDTFMTLVVSAYCGIIVESGKDHKGRVNVVILGEVFSALASGIIFPIDFFSVNMQDFPAFQVCTVLTSILAGALLVISGWMLEEEESDANTEDEKEKLDEKPDDETGNKVLTISWQIIREPRFLCLVGANFCRMMRLTACDQFLIILVESLLSRQGFMPAGSVQLSIYYVLVRALGRLLFVLLFVPISKLGAHPIILILNAVTTIGAVVAYVAGRLDFPILAGFILLENIVCRCGVHGIYTLISGEVIDTDTEKNKRKSPISTLIFTLKALFDKPAGQISPVLVLLLLDFGGYSTYKDACGLRKQQITTTMISLNSTVPLTDQSTSSLPECDNVLNMMFLVVIGWPILCGIGESLFIAIDLRLKKRFLAQRTSEDAQLVQERKLSYISMKQVRSSTEPL